jgi:hypothetical protein
VDIDSKTLRRGNEKKRGDGLRPQGFLNFQGFPGNP